MKKILFAVSIVFSVFLSADDFSYRGIFLGMNKSDLLREVDGLPYIETSDKIVIGNYHDSSVLVTVTGNKVSDFTVKTDSEDDKNEFIRLIAELSAKFGKPFYLDSKKFKALFAKDGKFVSLRINKKSSGFTRFIGFGYSKECYSIKSVLED
ncbi:MAG TPA: hypothetical protein PK624_06155 [Spirochaetota bacterium]|nr:hypothetical protein [Spirochaetota bacterium]HOR44361.1 hypothetical protein [Spirochaetota bacterium]HPK55840.1 hypothetical protein [Spirochaetota bacterium]